MYSLLISLQPFSDIEAHFLILMYGIWFLSVLGKGKYPNITVAQMQVRNVWMDDIVINKTDDHIVIWELQSVENISH